MDTPVSCTRTPPTDSAVQWDHPRILLVLELRSPASVAIERAMSLASGRSAIIDVVAVMGDGWRRWEHRPAVLARFGLGLGGIATNFVRHLEVRTGSFRAAAIAAGLARRPDLVVFAADPTHSGAAGAIAESLDVPVLVARDRRPFGPIIAATDLRDLGYPLLRAASGFGEALAASVTFFHNAALTPDEVDPMLAPSLDVAATSEEVVESKRARLMTLARDAGADAIVVRSGATADAILDAARSRDADLVVVGHRHRSWLRRFSRGRLVDDLVARSPRSVVVLPIDR